MQPLHFFAVDETAAKALQQVTGIPESRKQTVRPSQIAEKAAGSRPVIVASKLDMALADVLHTTLRDADHPFLLYPDDYKFDRPLKRLLKSNVVLVPIENDSLMHVSLIKNIEGLYTILTETDEEEDYSLAEEDLDALFIPGALNALWIAEASNAVRAVYAIVNRPRMAFKETDALLCTFQTDPRTTLLEITDAVKVLESRVHEMTHVLYQVRPVPAMQQRVRALLIVSVPVELPYVIQQEIDQVQSYMQRLAVIAENLDDGFLSQEEAEDLAFQNRIEPEDLRSFLRHFIRSKNALVELMRSLRSPRLTDDLRKRLIARAVVDATIEIEFLDELARTYRLNIGDIELLIERIKEGEKTGAKVSGQE